MRWLVVAGVACSSGQDDDNPPDDTDLAPDSDADTDADSDADTDADADADADADTGFEPYQEPRLRVLHVAAGVPGQDMFGNGLAGNPPLVNLEFLEGTPYVGRPSGHFLFEFQDSGASEPWTAFYDTLLPDTYTSFLVYGTPNDRAVLVLHDDLVVPLDVARVRWTHAAPSLVPNAVILRDVGGGPDFANGVSIAYGSSVESDEDPGTFEVWIDLDESGDCGPGEAFEPFDRPDGEYHHIVVAEDEAGVFRLVTHTVPGPVLVRPIDPTLCL
jgi:hypothetical protein